MDAQLKARWLEAPRSGEYKQCGSSFKKDLIGGGASFCCLGVLCTVANEPTRTGISDNWGFTDRVLGLMSSGKKWSDHLADMNDSPTPFWKMADYIEKNL